MPDDEFQVLKADWRRRHTIEEVLLDAIPFVLSMTPGGLLVRAAVQLSGEAVRYYLRSRSEKTGSDRRHAVILKIPKSSARAFRFGSLGVQQGIVYAVNPMATAEYTPIASFHDDMIVHKVAELQRLLNHLGAKQYVITHAQNKRINGNVHGSLGKGLFSGKAKHDQASEKASERTWTSTSDGRAPALPENLSWFYNEPDWQELAEDRLNGSRKKFEFTMDQRESFNVSASLAAAVELAKLDIGGEYASYENVQFRITGEF